MLNNGGIDCLMNFYLEIQYNNFKIKKCPASEMHHQVTDKISKAHISAIDDLNLI